MITRERALEVLKTHVSNPRMIAHCLASELVLEAVALKLGKTPQEAERWSIAGLLHDVDVEITNADLKVHGLEAVHILEAEGLEPELVEAIVLHNEVATGRKRETELQYALAAGETITGLIMATAMVYPDKRLASVKSSSVVKRMKEKAFAASVNRDIIRECEKIGLPLADFAEIAVRAMQAQEEMLMRAASGGEIPVARGCGSAQGFAGA